MMRDGSWGEKERILSLSVTTKTIEIW